MVRRLAVRVGNWGAFAGAVFLSAIALLITLTVAGRAVHIALPGTFDLVETLVIVGIAFALVYGQIEDRHLRAEIAVSRLKGRLKAGIEAFAGLLSIVYWAVLLWAAWEVFLEKLELGESTDILNVPIVPFRAVWIVALVLMTLLLVFRCADHVKALLKGGESA